MANLKAPCKWCSQMGNSRIIHQNYSWSYTHIHVRCSGNIYYIFVQVQWVMLSVWIFQSCSNFLVILNRSSDYSSPSQLTYCFFHISSWNAIIWCDIFTTSQLLVFLYSAINCKHLYQQIYFNHLILTKHPLIYFVTEIFIWRCKLFSKFTLTPLKSKIYRGIFFAMNNHFNLYFIHPSIHPRASTIHSLPVCALSYTLFYKTKIYTSRVEFRNLIKVHQNTIYQAQSCWSTT